MVKPPPNAPQIIEKLASNEESIGRLYQGYADAFPVLRDFWMNLASEETKHASLIRSLAAKSGSDNVLINERRFNIAAVQTFIDEMDKELARLKQQSIPVIEALSITASIEQSLIESKYFEVFATDSALVKQTLMKLQGDTLSHRNRAQGELEKFKKQ
jgi:hypothetical protein